MKSKQGKQIFLAQDNHYEKVCREKHDNSAVKSSYVPPAMKNIPDQKKGSRDKKKKRRS